MSGEINAKLLTKHKLPVGGRPFWTSWKPTSQNTREKKISTILIIGWSKYTTGLYIFIWLEIGHTKKKGNNKENYSIIKINYSAMQMKSVMKY